MAELCKCLLSFTKEVELSDSKWFCDLAFMVDIAKNIIFEVPNQPLICLLLNVKSFEEKLKLGQVQLERGYTACYYFQRTMACCDI